MHPGLLAAVAAVILGLAGLWYGATAQPGARAPQAARPDAAPASTPSAGTSGQRGGGARVGDIVVRNGYLRQPASAEVAEAYLSIQNIGREPDTLSSVYCGAARSTTLHDVPGAAGSRVVPSGTAARHVPAGPVTIAAGSTLTLAPGRGHIMLEGLTGPLRPGDRASLLLSFQRTGEVLVELPVLARGAPAPTGGG